MRIYRDGSKVQFLGVAKKKERKKERKKENNGGKGGKHVLNFKY